MGLVRKIITDKNGHRKNVWVKPKEVEPTKSNGFSKWFKGSKIVNEDGSPMVVYHGTKKKFDKFTPDKMSWQSIQSQQGAGYYFTDNEKQASGYGKPMKIMLSIKNPFMLTNYSKNITREQAIKLYSKGTSDYFYNNWIPFYTHEGEVSKEDIAKMTKGKKVELYVDKLMKYGDKDLLQNLKRAYSDKTYSSMLNNLSKILEKDGLIYTHNKNTKVIVAWDAEQIKIVK